MRACAAHRASETAPQSEPRRRSPRYRGSPRWVHSCAATYLSFVLGSECLVPGPWINAPDRGVEKLDGVHNRPVVPESLCRCGDLQRAPRIAGRNHIRGKRCDVSRFPCSELSCRVWLHEIVDARASTANLRFKGGEEFDAGNGLEERARFGAHALSMRQMAGVVIDHTRRDPISGCAWRPEFNEDLRNIANLLADRPRP